MLSIQSDIPLSALTTFRIGGKAAYFCEVRNIAELEEATRFAQEKNLSIFVLGGGSNTLVSDKGFEGLVIRIMIRGVKLKDLDYQKMEVEAGAGESWDDLVAFVVREKLYGLENLSAIPGTVGAAPVQNIGAYGAEVKDVISFVEVFDMKKGEVKVFSPSDCEFGYRDSIFKRAENKHLVITKVGFVLEKQGRVNIGYKDLKERFKDRYSKDVSVEEVRQAVLEIRAAKLPDVKKLGTAGSFFKNPVISKYKHEKLAEEFPGMPGFAEGEGFVKVPLAWILDKVCNLKGWKHVSGKVGAYETQPIALVNLGGATFTEVAEAAAHIAEQVKQKTGIDIEWEVQKLG